MKFWDASAIVPLLVQQSSSALSSRIHKDDPTMIVWWGSLLECESALARLHRQGELSKSNYTSTRKMLTEFAQMWIEVNPSEDLRKRAARLLRVHPLRTADALQLAAALTVVASDEIDFVCMDNRLRDAAGLEGFALNPEIP